jgi:hypothetical protein
MSRNPSRFASFGPKLPGPSSHRQQFPDLFGSKLSSVFCGAARSPLRAGEAADKTKTKTVRSHSEAFWSSVKNSEAIDASLQFELSKYWNLQESRGWVSVFLHFGIPDLGGS